MRRKVGRALRQLSPTAFATARKLVSSRTASARRSKAELTDVWVSAVITVFNQARSDLDRTLAAVRAQTYRTFEVVIVDDGSSSAETREWLNGEEAAISDGFVVRLEQNRGVANARNVGAGRARGELLVFLDPGDALDPTYFEKAVLSLVEHGGRGVFAPTTHLTGDRDGFWLSECRNPAGFSRGNLIPVASMHSRSLHHEVGGFEEVAFEDWDYWARIVHTGATMLCTQEPLFQYVFSETSGRNAAARDGYVRARTVIERRRRRALVDPGQKRPTWPSEGVLADACVIPEFNPLTAGRLPVVFVLPWFARPGGDEIYIRSLSRALRADGRTVVGVSTAADAKPSGYQSFADAMSLCYQLTLRPEASRVPYFNEILQRLLGRAVVVNVGSEWFAQNLLAGRLAVDPRRVIDVQLNHVGHIRSGIELAELGAVSVLETQHLERFMRSVVPNARLEQISCSHDAVVPSRDGAGQGAPKSGHSVWIGRNSPEQNLGYFLAVCAQIPEVEFVIATDVAPDLGSRGAPGNVQVQVDLNEGELQELLVSASSLCLTSDVEGMPQVVKDALMAGVPVVSRPLPGLFELAASGADVRVLQAEDDDPLTFATALRETLSAVRDAAPTLPDSVSWATCSHRWRELLAELDREFERDG